MLNVKIQVHATYILFRINLGACADTRRLSYVKYNNINTVTGVSLLALSAVQGYHGYVLFVWLYGVCLGGFLYSLKMFTMERVKSRYFTRACGFVQGAEAIPVLVGVPITGLFVF